MKDITIRVSGALTIGQGDVQLHNAVRGALHEGYDVIVLDFENVTYMDSSAVGELAASVSSVNKAGKLLGITKIKPKIRHLLSVMAFLEIFNVFDSNEEAIATLKDRLSQ